MAWWRVRGLLSQSLNKHHPTGDLCDYTDATNDVNVILGKPGLVNCPVK
jgi:hypothetical protein